MRRRLLGALSSWRSLDEIARDLQDVPAESLQTSLGDLVAARMVDCSSGPPSLLDRGLTGWSSWGVPAAFFHFDTKDVEYADQSASGRHLQWHLEPPPPRDTPQDARIDLPPFRATGEFEQVLLARRSWRSFGQREVTFSEVSSLLGLTWGIQRWMHPREGFSFPLKTSPSGGACHGLEVYMLARRVQGLEPGLYAYSPDTHALARRGSGWTDESVSRALGNQRWTTAASAVFLVTAVFERLQWKYKFGRAYRVVLLEAGHFCQTFCLVATRLKLAPFCTAALADTEIEQALGVDGTSESVIYAMGVGSRPPGLSWAPWSDAPPPRTTPAAYKARFSTMLRGRRPRKGRS